MSEIEKQVIKEFNIKPTFYKECVARKELETGFPCNEQNCEECGAYYTLMRKPQFTDSKLLQLISILARNCYTIEISNILTSQGTNEFVVNFIKEPTRYHSHSEDLKTALLKGLKLLKEDEDIQVEVQALFKDSRKG